MPAPSPAPGTKGDDSMAGRGGRDPVLRLERARSEGEGWPRPSTGSGVLSSRPASRVGLSAWPSPGGAGARGREPGAGSRGERAACPGLDRELHRQEPPAGTGRRGERAAGSRRGVAPVRPGPAGRTEPREVMTMALGNAIRSLVINTLLLRERWGSGAAYNPLSARVAQDPYPDYARLRERRPGAPQPPHERVGVLALRRRGHGPPRPSALLERPGQARPQPPAARHPCRPPTTTPCCSSTRPTTRDCGPLSTRRSPGGRSMPSSPTSAAS